MTAISEMASMELGQGLDSPVDGVSDAEEYRLNLISGEPELEPADDQQAPENKGKGEFVWDEEETKALRQAREDDERATSADSVRAYLKAIGKVALLKAEEEVDLAQRIEAGLFAQHKKKTGPFVLTDQTHKDLDRAIDDGQKAKDHLLQANLRLVVSLAKRYTGRGMAFLDLIQEGNLGLMRAVEKFDYTKSVKFSVYATWWIRDAITRGMEGQARTIYLTEDIIDAISRLRRTRNLMQDLGREPTLAALAKEMGVSLEKILELRKYACEPISFDTPIGEEGDGQLGDLIEDSDAIVAEDAVFIVFMQDTLHSVLATLSEREAGVIRFRFGLIDGQPRTHGEIAQVYGATTAQIRQIESRTLAKLQHPSRSQVLRDFYDD